MIKDLGVEGRTIEGGYDPAKEKKRYTIGVDSDQYLLYKDKDSVKASFIVTSMKKNVVFSLYRAITLYKESKLPLGKVEALGIKENSVGVANNENYKKIFPEEFRNKIKEIEKKIISSEIKVDTAFGK